MAEPLKHQFGPEVAERIAVAVSAACAERAVPFDAATFVAECLDGYDALELSPRAQRIADRLADHLPLDRTLAMEILLDSLGPTLLDTEDVGMAVFVYWPHVKFVAEHGQGDFETAMRLQYELTKRFTAEFSIRAYLVGEHRDATLARLAEWAHDPDPHVRRLVSEGSRPRLPWAPRLREFVEDPGPVIDLLELLRHDDAEYVRRSVANNLNDVAKDHPGLVVDVCRRWWADAANDDERKMVRHALRTLLKAGDAGALDVLGFGAASPVRVAAGRVAPTTVPIGGKVVVEVDVENPSASTGSAIVDLRVHFVKANGSTSPKVFKGAEVELVPGESRSVRKTISVAQQTTRTHYAGRHRVDAIVNGTTVELVEFEVTASG